MATLCGAKFSILASSAKAKPMMESMVQQYGMNDRMASVETFDLPIEDFMKDRDLLYRHGSRKQRTLRPPKVRRFFCWAVPA